jgi:amino acid transporter
MWSVTGWASGVYVAEETHDAARNVPRSVVRSFLLMSGIGLVISIVTAFCVTDMDTFAGDETGYPAYTLIATVWGTKVGFAFSIIIWVTLLIGGSGSMITSACQIAAFARDGGLPFPHIFTHVHKASNIPIWSNVFLLVGGLLILLFALSKLASEIIYSLAVIAALITFAIPMALRCFAGPRWIPGSFNLGRLSIPIHAWAVLFNLYMCVMECFPGDPNLDKSTFNYNWVFALGVSVLITITWFFVRHQFKGLNLEALEARQNKDFTRIEVVSSDIGGNSAEGNYPEESKE